MIGRATNQMRRPVVTPACANNRTSLRAQEKSSHQSKNIARASNSTPTPTVMAKPVRTEVVTALRRSAASFASRKRLAFRSGNVSSIKGMGLLLVTLFHRSFEIRPLSQHPFHGGDAQ